jgi:hypothetical protein
VFGNRGALRFEPIADPGLEATAAVHAIGAADLDNDGDRDLVLADAGLTVVMANRGDGTFSEAARFEGSGTTEHVLPVDVDGDGLLDLYLSNYALRDDAASQNRLYLNQGGLQYSDVGPMGPGLSWTATGFDLDHDGDQDLYVANDTLLPDPGGTDGPSTANRPVDLVLRNDGPGPDGVPRFVDIATDLGLARPRSSMGGVVDDFDEDGILDLYVPNFGANRLFLGDAAGRYVERANELGVEAITRVNDTCDGADLGNQCLVLTWSAALSDFDLDGHAELLLVNGDVIPDDWPPVMLFTRGADLPYREVATEIPCMNARGTIATDLDADGDQDVVIAQTNGPLSIFENRGTPPPGTWLQVALRGQVSNRDGVGAVVTIRLDTGRVLTRAVGAGGVVHSASPAEAFFGVGAARVVVVTVLWPSGRRTELIEPPTGTTLVLAEGP